jgi:16S rRNA (cytidine1402-2'-O)-methyltransferase
VRRDSLAALAAQFSSEPPPKGEVVVLVGPPLETVPSAEDIDALLVELLKTQPVSEAAAEAAARTGVPRRDLYRRALALKQGGDGAA